MSNGRRLQRGVVKQLSNLSIDEVSLVDRGANQHALISIAKRAPEAADYFEPVEKDWAKFDAQRSNRDYLDSKSNKKYRQNTTIRSRFVDAYAPSKHEERKSNYRATYEGHPKTAGALGMMTGHGAKPTAYVEASQLAGAVGGGVAGATAGHKLGGDTGALVGGAAGVVGGAAAAGAHAGKVVHNHFYGGKSIDGDESVNKMLDVDALFSPVEKKSSFGRGGEQAGLDEFSGDDPTGVTDDPNGEEGDVGPGGKVSGVEVIEGEDTPPKKAKKKSGGTDINPADKAGLGKSADFWKNVVEKLLDDDFEDDEDVDKNFPGPPGGGGFQPQNPMASPFPGAQGMGQPPMMQTPGVQPMGMGQPAPPMGGMGQPQQAPGGMPSQLPPDVVQYIQQLEQALDQLTGGDQGNGSDGSGSDDSSSSSSSSDSSSNKNNPFGKSLETSVMDETTFLTELAKSLDDDDDREYVNKALETVRKAEYRAEQAETIAKAERDLRLEREFIAKAAELNLPMKSADLGPVLKRVAEAIDEDDFKVIVKCLRATSANNDFANPYAEVGKRGGGDNADILSEVDAKAAELVNKSEGLTPEVATLQVLNSNPAAYDEYLREQRTRTSH